MNTKGKIPMSEFHNPYFLRKSVRIVVDIRFACKHKRTLTISYIKGKKVHFTLKILEKHKKMKIF